MISDICNIILRNPRPFSIIKQMNDLRCNETIEILRSNLSWENEQVRALVVALSGSGLAECFDSQQLQETINHYQNTVIFSLVSKEYLLVGENWARYMSFLGLSNYVLFCGDRESYDHLRRRDIPCIELKLPGLSGQAVNSAGFLPKGLLMASLKFPICRLLLEKGHDVVFSDIDAFWIKNPMDLLEKSDHDLAFQNIYLFPQEIVKLWGFAACSGFFFVRSSEAGLDLIKSAQEFVIEICDDQAALNLALVARQIHWDYGEPELVKSKLGNPLRVYWQGIRSGYGIYSPVKGRSFDGSLVVTSLPQDMFRRHMFLDLSSEAIHVFHPNSPKSEQGKLDVFERSGFPVTSVRAFTPPEGTPPET